MSLVTKMAKSSEEIVSFLMDLAHKAKPFALKDMEELNAFSKTLNIEKMEAWDIAYLSEKLRQAKYSFSENEVKQYFPEHRVLKGLFKVVETIFKLKIIKTETPTWHNDLKNLLDGASLIEKLVEIHTEISVIVARNRNGETKCFPVAEMEFNEANMVEKLICPSSLDEKILHQANEIAMQLIASFNLCGLLAVEMFVDKNKEVWVNEIAPRPHNSGHHTIESVITSQYEQLLRAIFNFPLGSTLMKMPSVMINLLGEPDYEGPVKYEGLTDCMSIEGVKIHLYGKKITKPYRKMGHVTVLATSIEEAKKKADIVKQKLKVKSW
jgi:5-(carboxyamino)imidazole ribonucleotide synthase